MKNRTDFESKIQHSGHKRKGLRVVGVGYVSTPDADMRLARAIDILMRSTPRELEGRINAEKEEEPPQDSRPEGVADQTDEGKV